ncbi:hypothetical protein B0H21DRAFT_869361 [Amylocystis lapponica]|nr:hypothetical protein B0H21DRAFT_869361 [Amylocystis lapponica]
MPHFNPFWIRRDNPIALLYDSELEMDNTSDIEEENVEENTDFNLPPLFTRSAPTLPVPGSPPRDQPSPAFWEKIQSTPYKAQSVARVRDSKAKIKSPAVLEFLKGEFRDKIYHSFPVEEFVKRVWNFEANDHPTLAPKIRDYLPNRAALHKYNIAPDEESCYPHLATICKDLMTYLFPDSSVRPVQSNIVIVGNHRVIGEYSLFKPDLTWSTTPGPQDQHWDWLLLYAEVKRERVLKPADVDLKTLRKGKDVAEASQQTSNKRKVPSSERGDVEPSAKRRKGLDMSPDEAQTAKYMNEILSHGVRSFASGFFIKNQNMHLWYGDRMGFVQSRAFNWQLRPHLLALVFAAVGQASLLNLGISPFLEFSLPSPAFENYDGARIVLPADEVVIGDGRKGPSTDMVFSVDVDTKNKVWTDWGAVGRGTTIVPLTAVDAAAKQFGTEALVAKMAWPHAHRTPEETFIRAIRSKLKQKAPGYLHHIVELKCSVSRNMNQMHLPRAFMDMALPEDDRRDFRIMILKKYERLCFVNSVDEFKTIFEHVVRAHHWVWTASDIFHHDISINNVMFYRDAEGQVVGVLCDWDLAERTLSDAAYQRDDDRIFPVQPAPKEDPNSTTVGQSSALPTIEEQSDAVPTIEEEEEEETPEEHPHRPRYRTGTGPFIALEILLQKEPPLHRYRYELESLFYLLAVFCLVFDPPNHQFGRFDPWEQGDLDAIARHKKGFYTEDAAFWSTFSQCHDNYQPLVKEWVRPLYMLFSDATGAMLAIAGQSIKLQYYVETGKTKRIERKSAKIKAKKEAWWKKVTYETFMKCLKLSPHLSTDPECLCCSNRASS